jgi:hypothetical protein
LKWNGEPIGFAGGTQSFTANILAEPCSAWKKAGGGIGKIETAGCEHGNDQEANGIIFEAQKINAPPLWSGL